MSFLVSFCISLSRSAVLLYSMSYSIYHFDVFGDLGPNCSLLVCFLEQVGRLTQLGVVRVQSLNKSNYSTMLLQSQKSNQSATSTAVASFPVSKILINS
jgi:hypothetical protein